MGTKWFWRCFFSFEWVPPRPPPLIQNARPPLTCPPFNLNMKGTLFRQKNNFKNASLLKGK